MSFRSFSSALIFVCCASQLASATIVWPSKYDNLEEINFVGQTGREAGMNTFIPNCERIARSGTGTQLAASWLRTAYHDMATFNAAEGVGGLDASILFELDRAENVGAAFEDTFNDFFFFYGKDTSMADLIAVGAGAAVHICGGPILPMRFGRVDANGPGDPGVPEPHQTTKEFVDIFARSGFNTEDMIKMVACGHTIGGVHGIDFPNITGDASSENFVKFDSTFHLFDEKIVTDFFNETVSNPLVSGPSNTTSDSRVFGSDGNVTMRALTDPQTFQDSCKDILTRMIETVPKTVQLTDVIEPYDVKPFKTQLTLLVNGSIGFTGSIRVRTTGIDNGKALTVFLTYSDRAGQLQDEMIPTIWGDSGGMVEKFEYYDFSAVLPKSSISNFKVTVESSGNIQVHDNGGSGFPIQDKIIFQLSQSCVDQLTGELTVIAAVRSDLLPSANPTLEVLDKVPRKESIVPSLIPNTIPMKELKKTQSTEYTLFTASYKFSVQGALFLSEFAMAMDGVVDQYRKNMVFVFRGLDCMANPTDGW